MIFPSFCKYMTLFILLFCIFLKELSYSKIDYFAFGLQFCEF